MADEVPMILTIVAEAEVTKAPSNTDTPEEQ